MTAFLSLLAYPLLTTVILLLGIMVITWIIALLKQNAGVVDIAWGVSIGLVAVIAFLMGDGDFSRRFILLGIVILWALRLSIHLFFRFQKQEEDRRYARMRKEWGDKADIRFLFVFLLQGLLILILTLPFFAVSFNVMPRISGLEWFGAIVALLGIAGETAADWQLKTFKAKRENRAKVLSAGLWGLSRHPNYFFEWIFWVGLAFFAFSSPFGWLGIFSALIMFYLLTNLSGIPWTEKELIGDRQEEYLRYQQEVNSFFPWPKRSS